MILGISKTVETRHGVFEKNTFCENVTTDIKEFDDFEEGLKLIKISSATKGNLLDEFADEIEKAGKLSNI